MSSGALSEVGWFELTIFFHNELSSPNLSCLVINRKIIKQEWGIVIEKNKLELELKLNNRLIFETTALGFMMMASSITGLGGASFTPFVAPEKPATIEVKESLPTQKKKVEVEKGMKVEEYVRSYFSDIPVMIEIARCESHFRQFDENGEVLRGEQNNLDRGVMQINEFYHNKDSDKLGYDIQTLEGNTSYARHLFEKYGVRPWKSSAPCWGRTTAYSEYQQLAIK